jgi:excisionase family DNA binding protein
LEKTNDRNEAKTTLTIKDFRLMTSPEAALYLQVSYGTLRHWICDRKIECVKLGRIVRFRKAHLDRFLSQSLQKDLRG